MEHPASDADVARVRSRLAAGGWLGIAGAPYPQYFGPTNSSSRATAPRRATDIELRRE
jgi:hypothetical protein